MIVALDTNIFIYWLDANSPFNGVATKLLEKLLGDDTELVCATLVITEFLSKPGVTLEALVSLPIKWRDLDGSVAEQAGRLRQTVVGLKTPDAVHLATALDQKVDVFITNDLPLAKLARRLLPTQTLR